MNYPLISELIANKLTAKPQVGVDYRGQNMVKLSKTKNIPPKVMIFSDFCLPLPCH